MGTQPGQVGDEKFSNWVKDTLALLYTKECLEVIADERSTDFYGQLKTAVGNNSTCTCSWQALNQDRKQQKWVVKNCPGVCQNWLDLIISHHSNRPLPKLAPRNTNPGHWPSDTWEVMKVYQSNGCQGHRSARDADVAALIDLMRNCNHFGPLITNPSLINKVITVRNKLMHSKDFKVENQELSDDLQSMLSFLHSLTAIAGASSLSTTENQAVQTAITEVDKLCTSILDMTLNRELQLKAIQAKQVALETDMKVLEQTIDDARVDTAAVKSGLTDVEDKLSTEVQTLQQHLTSQLSMIQDVKKGLASQQTMVQDVKKGMASQQSMIQDVKKDMTVQQQSTAAVVGNLARLQQQFDDLRLDHDETKNIITALKQQISNLEATSQNQQQESQAHASQLEKHHRELDTHTTKLSQLELRQKELDTHTTKLSQLELRQKELDTHTTKLSQLELRQKELDTHTTKLSQLELRQAELDTHTTKLSQLELRQKELDTHTTKLSQLELRQAELDTHTTKLSQLELRQKELDTHTTKLSQLELRQAELDTHKPMLQDHATQLQCHQSHIESQHKTLECHGVKLDRLENKQIALQIDQAVDIKGIQLKLIRMYEAQRQYIPVYLLRSERKLCLEDIYVEQLLKVVDPDGRLRTDCTSSNSRHQARSDFIHNRLEGKFETGISEKFIDSLRDVFYSEGNKCQYVYVSGNAGFGKSVFCSYLVRLWCKAHSEQSTKLNPDEEAIAEFPLLFYVDLRDATYKLTDQMPDEICSLIHKQLQLSQLGLTGNDLSQLLQAEGQVLVVMDALDECKEERLPIGSLYNNCTTIVTSRPWKLEALRCDPECRVDKELEIVGLKEGSPEDLSEKLVELLNKKWNKSKRSQDFIQKMKQEGLLEFMVVPVLLTSMLCLWFDNKPFGKSQCEIYKNSIHHQLLVAIKAKDLPEYFSSRETRFPVCQREKCPCQCYGELLWKVSELACKALLGNVRERSLVMDHDQTEILGLTDEEVAICMKLGILTQYKLLGNVTDYEPQKSVSFTHKTYQEWFAVIFLTSKVSVSELDKLFSEAINDLDSALELDQMFLFLSGLNAEVAAKLSAILMSRVSSDARVQEYCKSHYTSHSELIKSTLAEFEMPNLFSFQCFGSLYSSHDKLQRQLMTAGEVPFDARVQRNNTRHGQLVPSAAKVQSYRRSHYTSHDQLIRTIQDVVVAGAVEAKKNNKMSTALQLDYVSIGWYLYMGFNTEQILACDTSHAKSVFIEDVQIDGRDVEKRKTTPWPASSCLEKLHLRNVTNALDDTFCYNFSAAHLVHMYLDNVLLTHDQFERLCLSLATAGSLRVVVIYKLACVTHQYKRQDCSIMFDLCQHQELENLTLRDIGVGKVCGVKLCQNMVKLEKVELGNVRLSHNGIESLATAGSLREVVIRELTCITHKKNKQDCYVNLDISQYVRLEKICKSSLQRTNSKITSWPSSSCMEKIDLHHVDITPCDTFCGNFNLGNVAEMYLVGVRFNHDQLERLCASLTSASSLRRVNIRGPTCIKHQGNKQDCIIMLDLSQHQGLEELTLQDLGEIQTISLCQNMGKLWKVVLVGFRISAAALRQTVEALPEGQRVMVKLGSEGSPLKVREAKKANQLLNKVRLAAHTYVYGDTVDYSGVECVIQRFEFFNNIIRC